MKHTSLLKSSWSGILLVIFFLAACGGEEEEQPVETGPDLLECGGGTVLEEGQCVVADFACDEDRVASPSGVCLDPAQFCGSGSIYDNASQECVSGSDVTCGAGTVEVDGRCEVENAMRCGPGTVLADGVCRLSEEVCGAGTAFEDLECNLIESVCGDHAQLDVLTSTCVDLNVVECGDNTLEAGNQCLPFHSFVDELAEQGDLDFSDVDRTISVGNQPGDQVIFTGTMDNPSQLFHVFPFDGVEGQWLSITVYPRGLPSVGFRLREIFGPWERKSPPGYSSIAARTIVPPSTGDYDFIVESSLSTASGGPFADDSWHYVGVVEVLETPEAQPWDLFEGTLGGNLRDTTSNWLTVDVESNEQAILSAEALGLDAQGTVIEVWNSPTDFAERFSLQIGSNIALESADDPLYLLIDSTQFVGPRTHYNLGAQRTLTLASGATTSDQITAAAGEMIYLSHRSANATSLAGRVFLGSTELYFDHEILAENRNSYTATATKREFFYVPEDGTYTVEFENTTGQAIESFLATPFAASVPTFEPPAETDATFDVSIPAQGFERGDWRFVIIDAPGPLQITGQVEAASGRPYVNIYDTQRNSIASSTSFSSTQNLDFILQEPGVYILVIRPSSTISGGLTVDLQSSPVTTLEGQESQSYSFNADVFDLFSGQITYLEGTAPDVRLLNPDGAIVVEHLAIDTSLELLELLPGTGEFTLEVVNPGDSPTAGITVNFEVNTPVQNVNIEKDDQQTLLREDSLTTGDKEFILVRTYDELLFQGVATIAADEEISLLLLAVGSAETLATAAGTEQASLALPGLFAGIYVVEVEALTDLANGYELAIDTPGTTTFTATREHDPSLNVPEDEVISSTIDISGCSHILEFSLTTDLMATYSRDVVIDLLSPESADAINIRDGGFQNHQRTYPDDMSPNESFDPLIGQVGDGTWTLEIQNISPNWRDASDVDLAGWEIHLLCID